MPNPEMDRIEPGASKGQQDAAITACTAQEVRNGTPQDQAVAMCHSMLKDKLGTGGESA